MAVTIAPDTIYYYSDFVSEPTTTYEQLLTEIKPFFGQHTIRVGGNLVKEPRLGAFFSPGAKTGYTYSKTQRPTYDIAKSPTLMKLLVQTRKLLGVNFNSCLVNFYRDGNDNIGEHSDDERGMTRSDIASISLGAERDFFVKTKQSKKKSERPPRPPFVPEINTNYLVSGRNNTQRLVITMKPGCLIHMTGKCQQYYTHSVPKRKRVKTPRINITFRCV